VIICGIKVTHDGGVALIDNGRLVFSVEMEKIGNADRHAHVEDLAVVGELIRAHGYKPESVDAFVIDGWRKTHKVKHWGGQEVKVDLAPYRRGIRSRDLLAEWKFAVLDQPYSSYTHYAGHFASGYCTSPFAGGDAHVLVWDGAMMPYLYRYEAATGAVHDLGAVCYLPGASYHYLSQMLPPFQDDVGWPRELALPGKIMAYVAKGNPDPEALDRLSRAYAKACGEHVSEDITDADVHEALGRKVRQRMGELLTWEGIRPEDGLASIHEFMGSAMVAGLEQRLSGDLSARGQSSSTRLVMTGGCALNIKWNSRVRALPAVDQLWVPPFPNDAGAAIGTACCHMMTHSSKVALDWNVYSGPAFDATTGGPSDWVPARCSIQDLARLIHEGGQPVLLLHGRAELGPRALGHRSIIAPAVDPAMKVALNNIKGREDYRPVAPICIQDRAPEVFDPGTPDPYMLFDHQVRSEWHRRIPAVCHLDGSARLQTVSPADDPVLHQLLVEYDRLSGVPVLCNTSANLSGSGFFPDLGSAMRWAKVPAIWSDGTLWSTTQSTSAEVGLVAQVAARDLPIAPPPAAARAR
jgi:carbamoyltransferase